MADVYNQIARLKDTLEDEGDLLRWLKQPSAQLNGKSPQDVIDEGRPQIVADLIDDILSGSPS